MCSPCNLGFKGGKGKGGLLLRESEVQKTEWFLLLRKSAVGVG